MEGLEEMQEVMSQLGGLAALGSADLPARIFALWANALKALSDLDPLDGDVQIRLRELRLFCIERMEMVAATQPRPMPQPTPEP